jgi:hypothetical protein
MSEESKDKSFRRKKYADGKKHKNSFCRRKWSRPISNNRG